MKKPLWHKVDFNAGAKLLKSEAVKKLGKRLTKAFETDPVRDLAQELLNEGYTEEAVIKDLLRPENTCVSDVAKTKLRNYMRDIPLGVKR